MSIEPKPKRKDSFISSKELIDIKELQGEKLRQKKRTLLNADFINYFMNQPVADTENQEETLYSPHKTRSPQKLQEDHVHIGREKSVLQNQKKNRVSSRFFTRSSLDVGNASIQTPSKIVLKTRRFIDNRLDEKMIELDSSDRALKAKQESQKPLPSGRFQTLNRWQGVKIHSIEFPFPSRKRESSDLESQLAQSELLSRESLIKMRRMHNNSVNMVRPAVTDDRQSYQSTVYSSQIDLKRIKRANAVDKSRQEVNIDGIQMGETKFGSPLNSSDAQIVLANLSLEPQIDQQVSFGPSQSDQNAPKFIDQPQISPTSEQWRRDQRDRNKNLFLQGVVKHELASQALKPKTLRVSIERRNSMLPTISPSEDTKSLMRPEDRKVQSVMRQSFPLFKPKAHILQQDKSRSSNYCGEQPKKGNRSGSFVFKSETRNVSPGDGKASSGERSLSNSSGMVQTRLDSFKVGFTKQLSKADKPMAETQEVTQMTQSLLSKAQIMQGVQNDLRSRFFEKEMRLIKDFMQKIPFRRYKTNYVDPSECFPQGYTEEKGNAWAEHWYKKQQRQLEISQAAEQKCKLKDAIVIKDDSSQSSLIFGRSYSIAASPRKKLMVEDDYYELSRYSGGRRQSFSIHANEESANMAQDWSHVKGRTHSAQFALHPRQSESRPSMEQTVQQAHPAHTKPQADDSSLFSKSHLMAKLTFDANFAKRYFDQLENKKIDDSSSDQSNLYSSEEEKNQEETKKTDEERYPRGLNKLLAELKEKKAFNKLVKHANKNLRDQSMNEYIAQRNFVNKAVTEQVNPIPLINQINRGHLWLHKTSLKPGLISAFCNTSKQLKKPIKKLMLDRNLASDKIQADLIRSLATSPHLKSIVSIGNEFGRETQEILQELLHFDSVARLEELSISHSNADQRAVFNLLNCLLPKNVAVTEDELEKDTEQNPSRKVKSKKWWEMAIRKSAKQKEEEFLTKFKNKIKLTAEFKPPTHQIMLVPKEFMRKPPPGAVDKQLRAETFLVLKRMFLDAEVEHNILELDRAEEITLRQREIKCQLKNILIEKSFEPSSPEKGNKQDQLLANPAQVVPMLKRLGLASVIDNERVFSKLIEVIKLNKNLVELDLSWNRLLPKMCIELIATLSKHGLNLQTIDLSYITIGSAQLSKRQEEDFGKFIAKSRSLTHLNLAHTKLEGSLLKQLLINIKRSATLVSVHLCQAQLTPENMDFIFKKMKTVNLKKQSTSMSQLVKEYDAMTRQKHDRVHELMEFKSQIKESKQIFSGIKGNHGPTVNHCDCVILSRILGHPEIANSAQWKLSDKCWVCEKWKYTLLFYDERSGSTKTIQDRAYVRQFKKALCEINPKFGPFKPSIKSKEMDLKAERGKLSLEQMLKLNDTFIVGTLTNWQPCKMHSLSELVGRLERCKEQDWSFHAYRDKLLNQFKRRLFDCVQYGQDEEDICLIDFPKDVFSKVEHIFVYADFVRPGVGQYQILFRENQKIQLTVPKAFCVDPWRGHLKVNFKEYKTKRMLRKFEKNKSIFRDWREDNSEKLIAGFEEELSHWRVPKFIKDDRTQKVIFNTLMANKFVIKTVFLMLCSGSNYPSLSWLDFQTFLNNLGVVGVPGFQSSDADRVFIACKVPVKALRGMGMPETFMARHEFLDSIVRVAQQRFVQTKQIPQAEMAVQHVIKLMTDHYDISPWMNWRVGRLWNLECNDLLENNKTNLMRIYKSFFNERKHYMSKQEALELIIDKLGVTDKEALYCYGMCKMTCHNDIQDREQYEILQFVEFLEYLGRVAEGKIQEDIPLVSKLRELLKTLFAAFDLQLKTKKIEEEVVSCSEDEYDEGKYFDWVIEEFGYIKD